MDTPFQLSGELRIALAVTILVYLVGMFALAIWAERKVKNAADFVVAGRRLPLSLVWMTIMATWFGAGAMLTATETVREEGLLGAALDPLGCGVCLVLAGLLIARPLWKMGLLTVSDFFRRRFGTTAELIASLILVPSYFGWIAAQFIALANMLELYFGIELWLGILLVALVGMGYTLLGGMWSVTLTDAVQLGLVLLGLAFLTWTAFADYGNGAGAPAGVERLVEEAEPEMLQVVPTETVTLFLAWLGVFCAGALGNLPGQDLTQRIFSARSAGVAQGACLIAGVVYLVVGLFPIGMGLLARQLWPEGEMPSPTVAAFAQQFFTPPGLVIFTLALMSAVLSTIDSAILSPASVLAQNVFPRVGVAGFSMLAVNRIAVVLVTAASLIVAYLGESAYSLLEAAYDMILVSLSVPLMLGIYLRPVSGVPAIACMLVGAVLWTVHLVAGWEYFLQPWLARPAVITEDTPPEVISGVPQNLMITAVGLVVYLAIEAVYRLRGAQPLEDPEADKLLDDDGQAAQATA